MFTLLFKNFIRSRVVLVGVIIIMTTGMLSICIGRQHLQRQDRIVTETRKFQREHMQRNIQFFNKEIGLLLYYLKFGLINKTEPLNGLSIGQRDVNSSVQLVTIRNLENQKYDTELVNPLNLLVGNLDFSFVLIYLFPLLIVAFCFNLYAEEKEGGTWSVLAVQGVSLARYLLMKLFVRIVVVFILMASLFVMGIWILNLPLNRELAATAAISFSYLLCWFAIAFWMMSWKKGSSTTASWLLSAWLMLTMVLPAAVNNYLSYKYPVPEALATMVEQREGYHEKWDQPKETTMGKFYRHYPQYEKYGLPQGQFSWLWYYAMQQMGDDEASDRAGELSSKLHQKENESGKFALWIPSLYAQRRINSLARAGLNNHLNFLDSTTRFHERLRLYFYPKIFEELPVSNVDWKNFDVDFFYEKLEFDTSLSVLPLLLPAVLLMFWSVFNLKVHRF
jgi:ABC-2 type transport system permease protein